jgi:Cu-processing system permease protein
VNRRALVAIACQELQITIRNKWTILFAVVFGVLIAGIAYFGMLAEGFAGMQSFTRTSASVINMVLYLVPLVTLTMGTMSFTGDRGSTELLFSQPIGRSVVLLGKIFGLFGSVSISLMGGFVFAGVIIVSSAGSDGLLQYAFLVGLSLILSAIFLCLSALIAILNQRKAKAFGVALFVWFVFVLFYDLAAIGIALLLRGPASNYFLFISIFGNPVDMVRVAALITLDNVTIFGPAGAVLLRFLGGVYVGVVVLGLGLAVWMLVPLAIARRILQSQDV